MISLGNNKINKISVGSGEIKKISLGTTTIWQSGLDLSDPNLWEQGGFASTGEELTATTRIRTKGYYEIKSNSIKFKTASPYTIVSIYFKADGTFVPRGQRGSDFTESPPAGATKFRPSIATTPNTDNITVDEAVTANVFIEFL